MSAHSLPEDVNAWPHDPYALLGVSWGVEKGDLRRAYQRLVKVFKPEHAPEQFRRLREAYETVLRHADTGAGRELSWQAESLGPQHEPEPQPEAGETGDDAPERFSQRLLVDDLDTAWEEAKRGDPLVAARRLRELFDRRPGNQEVCLRMYWLLKMAPEADPPSTPADWLLAGLRSGWFGGPLRELLRRELLARPTEALRSPVRDLLFEQRNPEAVVELAGWRWRAACRLQAWKLIAEDVAELDRRIGFDDHELSFRLLLWAMHDAAWSVDADALALVRSCGERIDAHHAQNPNFFDALARCDHLREVSEQWRGLVVGGRVPRDLLDLVARSWMQAAVEYRPALMDHLATVLAQPEYALAAFTHIRQHAPLVWEQIRVMLGEINEISPTGPREPPPDAEFIPLVLDAFGKFNLNNYAGYRTRLLQFCLREHVEPLWVTAALERAWKVPSEYLSGKVAQDTPLLLLCTAHWLYAG